MSVTSLRHHTCWTPCWFWNVIWSKPWCTCRVFILLSSKSVWVCGCFLSFNSPLTMAVTWSLPIPMRFLTSQTKVVLTASSTFSIFSSLPVTCTVSAISPDILQGHKRIDVRKTKRGSPKKKWWWQTYFIVQCHQIPLILMDTAKPVSFLLPQKAIHYHTLEGNTMGTGGKSKLLDPVQKSHLSHFKVPDFHFL